MTARTSAAGRLGGEPLQRGGLTVGVSPEIPSLAITEVAGREVGGGGGGAPIPTTGQTWPRGNRG